MAWLCYHYPIDEEDSEEIEPKIVFDEPHDTWKYSNIIAIQFTVLHRWTHKDERLYK